jgi:NAD(P)-dependent dehydrogenase (short-subunit alcohol dehydrogenase family)
MHTSLFDLDGRTALVTGGSKGIGKAIATVLHQAGAQVMIASRHRDELDAAAEEIAGDAGGRVIRHVADMTERTQVRGLAEAAVTGLGHVDILVNNAGANLPEALHELTDASWDRIVELNLTSCALLSRALVPGMMQRRWGRIIYTASMLGLIGAAARSVYCATKGALISMAHGQAVELGGFGITVNCVSPGPILTDLPRNMLSESQRDALAARTVLGRWGEAQEVAGPVLLLASDAGAYMTGANLVVDGGVIINGY